MYLRIVLRSWPVRREIAAYRMLGSVGDAEDVMQDAYLRWHQTDGGADGIRSPEAWLVTVVTRLCLDRLQARAAERAAYDGPWLPEPWPETADGDDGVPGRRLERAADLSLAFLALLERHQRAVAVSLELQGQCERRDVG